MHYQANLSVYHLWVNYELKAITPLNFNRINCEAHISQHATIKYWPNIVVITPLIPMVDTCDAGILDAYII